MRIFDATIVNTEIDLLRVRLDYLRDVVDGFIVVEACQDFRGRKKPAWVRDSGLLDSYGNSVRLVTANLDVAAGADSRSEAWSREYLQRDALVEALTEADEDDFVVVCDVDEIPTREALARLRALPAELVRLRMRHAVGYANLVTRRDWDFPFAAPVADVRAESPSKLRFDLTHDAPVLPDAGWHLSYLFTPIDLTNKLSTFSHTELDRSFLHSRFHFAVARWLGAHPTAYFKLLDRVDVEELPTELRADPFVSARLLRRRGPLRAWAAAAYSVAVSVAIGENWQLRALRDRQRAWRRRLRRALSRSEHS